jgi:hypothetical protein
VTYTGGHTVTRTTFGTVTRFEDGRTAIYGAGIIGPVNQLEAWARQPGASWPCSELARLVDIAVSFDAAGDLVDISGAADDMPCPVGADKLNAWTSECLTRAGYPNHPAIRPAAAMR